jgi:hypothetical protein
MIQTDIPCRACTEPMIEIPIDRYLRIVCNKSGCLLYREGQGVIAKDIELEPKTVPTLIQRRPYRKRVKQKKARTKPVKGKKAR